MKSAAGSGFAVSKAAIDLSPGFTLSSTVERAVSGPVFFHPHHSDQEVLK
jgi:hypothetical protein